MGQEYGKKIILNIDWMLAEEVEEEIKGILLEKAKKKAKTASSPKAVKEPKGVKSCGDTNDMSLKEPLVSATINGPKLKEDLSVLVGYMMNLKKSLHQANLGDGSTKTILENMEASFLTIAADSALGNHNTLGNLSKAVTPHSAQGEVTSILVDKSYALLREKLSVP